MRRYLVARSLQAVFVVFFVTTVSFILVHVAPGDPIGASLDGPNITEAVRNHWRAAYGLDQPIATQYARWLANVFRGQLGYSFSQHRTVGSVFADALPRTALISGVALILSFAIGIHVALLQAESPSGARDRWLGRILLLLYSVPDFWLALVVLLVFAYRLRWFPAGGLADSVTYDYLAPWAKLNDRLRHLVLPVLTLTVLSAASIARYQRASLLAVLPSDWMRTAMAKGASWRTAVRHHAFRNALLPTITLAGLSLPAFVAGAVFVEKVFTIPGMGYVTITAVGARDYPLVTGGVLLMSIAVVIGALLSDLAVAIVDPRVRLS